MAAHRYGRAPRPAWPARDYSFGGESGEVRDFSLRTANGKIEVNAEHPFSHAVV
jgi:hypothetical protein